MKVCSKCFTESSDETRFCPNCGAPLPDEQEGDEPTLIGKTVADKFLVQEHVGAGAMGSIYKAEQINLGKTVCIKVLHDHLTGDSTISKRFHREARAASRLKHPNAISIIDFGTTEDNVHYIAMDFVDGTDLAHVIKKEFPLNPDRVMDILNQIASALDEAHAQGIIHRDLKPENIMLEDRRHQRDFVTVLDFGIAKIKDPDAANPETFATMAGIVCGTPEYMSPEQAKGDTLDFRTDLYALGVILYQMNTGRLPFTADTPIGVVTKHLTQEPPKPSTIKPNIHPAMENLILQLMSKDRENRPATAMEVKRLIEKVRKELHDEPDSHSKTAPMASPSKEELQKEMPKSDSADVSEGVGEHDEDEESTFLVPKAGPGPVVKGLLIVGILAGLAVGGYFAVSNLGRSGQSDDAVASGEDVAAGDDEETSDLRIASEADAAEAVKVVAVVDAGKTPEQLEAERKAEEEAAARKAAEAEARQERQQELVSYVEKLAAMRARYQANQRQLNERRKQWAALEDKEVSTEPLKQFDELLKEVENELKQVAVFSTEVKEMDSSRPLPEKLPERIEQNEKLLVGVEQRVQALLNTPLPQEPTEDPMQKTVDELKQRMTEKRTELEAKSKQLEEKKAAWDKAKNRGKVQTLAKYVEELTEIEEELKQLADGLNAENVMERRDTYNKSLGQTEEFFAEVDKALAEKVIQPRVMSDAEKQAYLQRKAEMEARRKAQEKARIEKQREEERKRQEELAKKREEEKKKKLIQERKEKGRKAEKNGDAAKSSGDYARAILYYKEARRLTPSANLHKKLGQAYNSKGDYARGAKHLRAYLRLMEGRLSPIKVKLIQKQIRD